MTLCSSVNWNKHLGDVVKKAALKYANCGAELKACKSLIRRSRACSKTSLGQAANIRGQRRAKQNSFKNFHYSIYGKPVVESSKYFPFSTRGPLIINRSEMHKQYSFKNVCF